MLKISKFLIIFLLTQCIMGQDYLPEQEDYERLPDRSGSQEKNKVLARMLDGLAFRYYWATAGLNAADHEFSAAEDSRSILELMQHTHDLSEVIYKTTTGKAIDRSGGHKNTPTAVEMRNATLQHIRESADILAQAANLETLAIRFILREGSAEYSFYNLINGPISDAIWHTGQIVMLRRIAGNPIDKGVNVFLGTYKN